MKNKVIICVFIIFIVLLCCNIKITSELINKQKQIDAMNIQINSLWENVQQLQDEYAKIVDKLYNPERNNNEGL